MNKKPLPEIGLIYKFYDDGKTGDQRKYWAKVLKIVPFDAANQVIVRNWEGREYTLTEIWKEQAERCNWLYAPKTDYFVCAEIPAYDDDNIWFVRTKDGGWFSIDIQSSWQSGRLDVDNTWFTENPEDYMTYWVETWEHQVELWKKRVLKKNYDKWFDSTTYEEFHGIQNEVIWHADELVKDVRYAYDMTFREV